MPRPRKVIRSIPIQVQFPEDVAATMDLHLFSPLEGRVPHGRRSEFIVALVRKHFNQDPANVPAVPDHLKEV